MSDLYREPAGYQDPVDDRLRKWVKRKPDPSIAPSWSWGHRGHTGIQHPSGKVIPQTSSQSPPKTPTHGSVSSGVRKKVAGLASPQPPASSLSKNPNIQESAITTNEIFIADRLLSHPNRGKLISACGDSSREQFQALISPLLDTLRNVIQGEIINPEHVLVYLRKILGITAS